MTSVFDSKGKTFRRMLAPFSASFLPLFWLQLPFWLLLLSSLLLSAPPLALTWLSTLS